MSAPPGSDVVPRSASGPLPPWRAGALVARREIRQRLASRAFVLATTIGALLTAVVVVSGLVSETRSPPRFTVASADHAGDLVLAAARAQASAFGVRLTVSRASARAPLAGVRSGSLDAALVGGAIVIARGSDDERLLGLLRSASERISALLALQRSRSSAVARSVALRLRPIQLRALRSSSSAAGAVDLAVPVEVLLLLFYCSFIGQGVVEEKRTRVVEVVLGAISARSLLAGKVAGLAGLALGQLLLLEAVGTGATLLAGVRFSHTALLDLLLVPAGLILGFAFYGCLYAAAGALCPPSGDIRVAQLPLSLLLLAALLLGRSEAAHLSSPTAQVLSLVPPLSPVLLPARLSVGAISPVELAAGLVLTIGSAAVLVRLASRAYASSILLVRTGGLREALRSVRG